MNQYKKPTRIFDLIITISIGILLIGTIFRIQHWPFGTELNFLSIVSLGIIIFLIGLRHFQKPKRNYLDSIELLIILFIISVQFNKLILFTSIVGLIRPLLLLSLVWLIMNVILVIRKKQIVQITIDKIILIIGLSCLIGEVILRSKHLPMGSVLSVAGLLITMAALIISHMRQKYDTNNIK